MTPEQLTDLITPILGKHAREVSEHHFSKCRCGWEVPARHSATQRHHKHVSTQIAALILGTTENKK